MPPQFPPQSSSDPAGGYASYKRKSPAQCALARTASLSPNNVQELSDAFNNNGESPNALRLKKMKDGMREMMQWCDVMIQEERQREKQKQHRVRKPCGWREKEIV